MSFYRPIFLTSFIITLVILGSVKTNSIWKRNFYNFQTSQDSLPQRNFRTNRRLARQEELDGAENEVTSTIQPTVYSNNRPGYGTGTSYPVGGYGNNGFSGLAFLPPPLMMMMMLRNAAFGGLLGPDGIDMVTVQRVLQAVVKVLQEVEQEKRATAAANPGVVNTVPVGSSSALRLRG